MIKFEKELRYYVIKVADAKQFSDEAKRALENVLYASQIVRKLRDAPQIDCVVVESDWPEYGAVWDMIQARVEGRPNQIATLQAENAKQKDCIEQMIQLAVAKHRPAYDEQQTVIMGLRDEIAALKAVIQMCFEDSCSPSGKVAKKTALELMKYADRKA